MSGKKGEAVAQDKAPPGKRKVGRPNKLTPEISNKICDVLRNTSATYEEACRFVGLGVSTLMLWKQKGEQARQAGRRGKFRDFLEAVEAAQANRCAAGELIIASAAKKDWKAKAWQLSIWNPKKYAPKVRVHVEEELTDALARIEKRLPPHVFEQVLEAIASGDRGGQAGADPGGAGGADDPGNGEAVQSASAALSAGDLPSP